MEIDFAGAGSDLAFVARLRTSVCVVGGGIAGLTLAHRLAEHGTDVLLLEAGGKTPDSARQDRLGQIRALGGTSLAWGGQLLPVQETDGWPVAATELACYGPEIEEVLGVDALPYEAQPFFAARDERAPAPLEAATWLRPRMSKFAPFGRRNLGASLGRGLLEHSRARVALHAEVTSLQLRKDGQRLEGVVVRTVSGQRVLVRASNFVIAAGTVETCRLLLGSRSVQEQGIGNSAGQVGSNLHDHLTVTAARLTGSARQKTVRQFRPWICGGLNGTVHSLKLEAGDELRRAAGVASGMAHFTFEEPGTTGLAALREGLRLRQRGQSGLAWAQLRQLPRGVTDLFRLHSAAAQEQRRHISERAEVVLRLNVAQRTPSSSRVRLSPALDARGEPQSVVDFLVTSEEMRGLGHFAQSMRGWFSPLGFGEAEGARWNQALVAGEGGSETMETARHVMGGACMGVDPRTSVVDGNLRIHGIDNLYVASAAVLPDGRAQLPTWTVMALSLRLADRLRSMERR